MLGWENRSSNVSQGVMWCVTQVRHYGVVDEGNGLSGGSENLLVKITLQVDIKGRKLQPVSVN